MNGLYLVHGDRVLPGPVQLLENDQRHELALGVDGYNGGRRDHDHLLERRFALLRVQDPALASGQGAFGEATT